VKARSGLGKTWNDREETPSTTPNFAKRNLQADDTTSINKKNSRTGFKRRMEKSLFLPGASQSGPCEVSLHLHPNPVKEGDLKDW